MGLMARELLFSLTKKDFVIQTFRAGGKGGQNQNKRNTGVRIIHPESGARGESREERSQYANRKRAFQRLVDSKEFKNWHRVKVAEILYGREERLKDILSKENFKIEYYDPEKGEFYEPTRGCIRC